MEGTEGRRAAPVKSSGSFSVSKKASRSCWAMSTDCIDDMVALVEVEVRFAEEERWRLEELEAEASGSEGCACDGEGPERGKSWRELFKSAEIVLPISSFFVRDVR